MRRTTLGPISSSQLNARQAAAAGAAAARMSLQSKPAGRRSIGPLGGASSRRVSAAARPAPPRTSVSRQSVGSGGRRSSAFGARASMSSRGGPRAQLKDPRQLTDRAAVHEATKGLIEFLVEHGYDDPLSMKTLRSPSRKDVYSMYQFLLRMIDPGFVLDAKFEKEIGELLRSLRYPFTLSKSALSAVGTPHTWPHLLGSILWLVELISYDELVQQPTYSAEEEEEENADKAFFEYLGKAYQVFLAGDDEQYSLLEKEEIAKHEEHNRLITQQAIELDQQQQELKKRIQKAKETKALLPSLRKRKVDCEDDLQKFHGYLSGINKAKTTLQSKIDKRSAELSQLQIVLNERNAQIAVLEKQIDQQEVKAEDIEQMAKERVRLSEQITMVTDRQKEIQNSIWQEETHIAEQMDNVESLVQKYTDTATQMKLLPLTAKHAYGFDYEIEIDAHTGGVEAATALTGHLKSNVRQALLNFKKNRAARQSRALDDVLELQDQVQRCREKLSTEEQREQNVLSLSRKFDSNMQRNRDAVAAAIKKKADETEEVEMEIQAIRDDKDTDVQQAHALQQLQDAERAYEAMSTSYTGLIVKNRQQVANALMSCTAHKETMEHAILSLEEELTRVWP